MQGSTKFPLSGQILIIYDGGEEPLYDTMAEWLRRVPAKHVGSPAQVRILLVSVQVFGPPKFFLLLDIPLRPVCVNRGVDINIRTYHRGYNYGAFHPHG